MKLIYRITLSVSVALTVILAVWAILFYFAMIAEINDEVDDSLEDYSENIIRKSLRNEALPNVDDGSNNYYFINEVSADYAASHSHIRYIDSMIYLQYKEETEPARILVTIFRNNENKYFELTVSTPTFEKHDVKESILHWIIFLYAALLVTLIAINVFIIYRAMRPMYTLLKWLDKYKLGANYTPLKNDTNVTEFSTLNKAIARSIERSNEMFEQQKQFIGNASHEIQTPLAICRNRLEMLAEDDSLSEKNLDEIFKTLHTLERITKLNKSLLLLTKIENNQFTDVKTVQFNIIINQYLKDFEEVYGYKNIKVETHENGIFVEEMNESLAGVLISNLLKNAFFHCPPNGEIKISVENDKVSFSNAGNAPLDAQHIFDRFYQGEKKEGSTGLGLAIAQSICNACGMKISYGFSDNFHVFKIEKHKNVNV